ncbi:glycosyl transferase [Idiomarina tyrosinivorans]|uniref:Glycosyl transferase n=1 Tax=Idiomarina tyrosinivorans TaxID=1445662 RepID=A0A432ZPX8_9GAMM|nr:glycosyltransferase family 39 protein [Idiomarina tyrosinivorans]RUO79902.1 glycosyl transferase [Idiomarina tyrosinivorans]
MNNIVNRILAPLEDENSRVVLAWILVFAAVLIFAGIGLRSPWPPDEPRFADVAREMVDTGQWFFPARGAEFYPDKPPVFMWSIAFFYWLTGSISVAALLPNALCSLVVLIAVFDLGKRLWNLNVGRNAALLLLVTPQFLIQAKFAQIDAMVACWITLGCYGLIRHFFAGPHWRWYFAAWGFMGLGIITKGVGFLPIFMLIPIALYYFFASRLPGTFRWRSFAGVLVMLAVIACWLVPMLLIVYSQNTAELVAYKNNILFKQTGKRYADSWAHVKPWYYMWTSVAPWFWLPASLCVLGRFKSVWQQCKADKRIAVLLGWVLLVIVFFSTTPGKRGVYILPALPMFALAVAAIWDKVKASAIERRIVIGINWIMLGVFTLLAVLAWMQHPKLMDVLDNYTERDAVLQHLALMLSVIVALMLVLQWTLRKHGAFTRYAGQVAVIAVIISFWAYPIMEPLRTPKNVMQEATRAVDGGELGIIEMKEQYLLFSPIPVTHFSYFRESDEQFRSAWQWIHEQPNRFIMAPTNVEFTCFSGAGAKDLGIAHREEWKLLGIEQADATCQAPSQHKVYVSPPNEHIEAR